MAKQTRTGKYKNIRGTGKNRLPSSVVTTGDMYRQGYGSAFGGGTIRQMGKTKSGNAKTTVVSGNAKS